MSIYFRQLNLLLTIGNNDIVIVFATVDHDSDSSTIAQR